MEYKFTPIKKIGELSTAQPVAPPPAAPQPVIVNQSPPAAPQPVVMNPLAAAPEAAVQRQAPAAQVTELPPIPKQQEQTAVSWSGRDSVREYERETKFEAEPEPDYDSPPEEPAPRQQPRRRSMFYREAAFSDFVPTLENGGVKRRV